MGFLDDIMTDYDAESFVDVDVFGEEIEYIPRCKTAVTINAVVFRDPPQFREGVSEGRRPSLVVYIRNHETTGRTSIDTGGDVIKVAYRKGGKVESFQVTGPVSQDKGLWRIELA